MRLTVILTRPLQLAVQAADAVTETPILESGSGTVQRRADGDQVESVTWIPAIVPAAIDVEVLAGVDAL